jgi:LAO/AO transport system kinase
MPRQSLDMVNEALAGERLALARLLTMVENDTSEGRAALDYLYPHTGKAHLVGITGSPGTGKSSLVNQLVKSFRSMGVEKVAVIAVDPSSSFTGGALLGDRVRMRDLSGDSGVFIRSMASRGALGGISRTTVSVAQVLDAVGYDIILIETVGAGQAEVEIARLAHTVVVVEAPGMGDEIQAMKAGILESADILVVNKCDLPGAERTARALKAMVEMTHPARPGQEAEKALWSAPILLACSTDCQGVDEITRAICAHYVFIKSSREWQRRDYERMKNNLDLLLRDLLFQRFIQRVGNERYQQVLELLTDRKLSPFEALERLLNEG